MENLNEAAQSPVAAGTVSNATNILADVIRLDTEKKAAKKVLDEIMAKFDVAKERVKNLFIEMGVNSMKSCGKNVYLSKKIYAGIGEDVDKEQLSKALIALNMDDYITCNAQKLSGYVREIIDEHPEFRDVQGDIIVSPEEIVAVLPEPFNTMFRVSEKIDVGVRK